MTLRLKQSVKCSPTECELQLPPGMEIYAREDVRPEGQGGVGGGTEFTSI